MMRDVDREPHAVNQHTTRPTSRHLILASSSPRRRQLLTDAGYRFEIDPSGIDEPEPVAGESAPAYVARLAWEKAFAVAQRRKDGLILGADTTCDVEGLILTKPVDRADAERMVRAQEGRDIEVLTGLVLYDPILESWIGALDRSICRFHAFSDEERTAYLDAGTWEGKAGAYGVQDDDSVVTVVSGSWTNVVGLPMERLEDLLRRFPEFPDIKA